MTSSFPFEPIKKSHAVGELVVYFEVLDKLFSTKSEAQKAKEVITPFFSRADDSPSVEINLDINGATTEQRRDGFTFIKFRDGTQEMSWVLRMSGNHLSLHSIDYTRWDAIFPQIIDYLTTAFSVIERPLNFSSIGIKVIDRFRFVGATPEDYKLGVLLDPNSKYISQHAFSAGQRWHVNTGWFEKSPAGDETEELLHQLNADSSMFVGAEGKNEALVSIDHSATLGNINRMGGIPLRRFSNKDQHFFSSLRDSLQFLHEKNKQIVFDLLNKEVASKINLVVEQS